MKRLILLVLATALSAGCATKYQIVLRDEASALGRRELRSQELTRNWENLEISVRPVTRREVSSSLRNKYTIFEVAVKNLGKEEVQITLEQFALIDSAQVQYSPFPPDEVSRASSHYYYPAAGGYGRRHHYGYGYGHYGYHHSYYRHHHFGLFHSSSIYYRESSAELYAFKPGPVVPGAQKEGWLFFRRVDRAPTSNLDFYFTAGGKIRLSFPFEVVEGY